MSFEEGPLYYREIQKNAYLKRVPNETTGSKFMQLGYKKAPPKPMWTIFCIHNGRTPYLEQYVEASSPQTLCHKPVWAACLRTARHVTASVKPTPGGEYDFLIDTHQAPVRMIAPDWDTMQDWVSTLRSKLHELKILSSGENVYCAAPAAPVVRAPARDPTSPLPPTPPVPPDRVPGIELIPPRPPPEEPQNPAQPPQPPEPIDISNWEEDPQPSTSTEQPQSVAKICGQNICLDDSILRRRDSTEDFVDDDDEEYKQTVKVGEGNGEESNSETQPQGTNITVIQVSNKGPPHTAIPVLGPETNIFNFDFKDKVTIQPNNSFVNIVNTENGYGSVFNEGDYGHLSMTTTVNLNDNSVNLTNNSVTTAENTVNIRDNTVNKTDNFVNVTDNSVNITNTDVNVTNADVNTPNNVNNTNDTQNQEGVYERLCMASTSAENAVSRLKNSEKVRKSSLPNLDSNESTYEYLFPNNGNEEINNGRIMNGNRIECNRPTISPNNPNIVRTNIERSLSQNAYDSNERVRERLIRPNRSPKRDNRGEKPDPLPTKPIWKRGLTELSLLSKLRIGGKRHESPTRQETTENDSQRLVPVTSPAKVVRRSRTEARVDGARRRSSSLNNGQITTSPLRHAGALQPLRSRQAAALVAEQRRGAAVAAHVSAKDPPVFVDYEQQVWICYWGASGRGVCGRMGDRVAGLGRQAPRNAQHAAQLVKQAYGQRVDILFHRVPLGKIYVLNRRDNESLGIKLDSECNIVSVDRQSVCARAGLPPPGKWAVTEVNNRQINLLKGGEEEMLRLSMHGTEVSILIQPSALVKKIRAALKANKHLYISR